MTDKYYKEIESKKEKSVTSRRVFLASGLFALINVPLIDLLLKRFNQKQTSFSFDGPFERGNRLFFDESAQKNLPLFPLNLQVGNNDIAVWYHPKTTANNIKMMVSLDLYGENDHVLSSQNQPITVEWSENAIFSGCNVRFQFPKITLLKTQKVTLKFRELS